MRYVLIICIFFYSISTQAQTTTLSKLNTTVTKLNAVIGRDSLKISSLEARFDRKDANDDARNIKIKRLSDSAIYLNPDQFNIDSVTKMATYIDKPDTFIIIKKSPRMPQSFQGAMASESTKKPYTLTFPQEDDMKEIQNLKDQVNQFEKTVNSREKMIDKLQKVIDKQQAEIDKLKAKKK